MNDAELISKLPPHVKIVSRVPFVITVEPGSPPLTAADVSLIQALQQKSAGVASKSASRWPLVKPTWDSASQWLTSAGEKALSLGKSLLSEAVGKELPLPVLQKRHISCFGKTLEGEYVQAPCENLVKSSSRGTHHCGACGCGDTPIAQLEPGLVASKLLYPFLECPLKKPGFSNEYEDFDFDNKKRMVVFDPATGGLGDVIAVMWLAGGYKEMGWDVSFLASSHDWLLRGAGFRITDDRSQGYHPLGHQFEPYRMELTIDKGKTPRLPYWASVLPSCPRPLKPTLTIPDNARRGAEVNWGTAIDLTGGKKGKKKILLAPFSHWAPRSWPLHHYYELASLLLAEGHTVVAIGLPANEVQLRGFSFGYAQMSLQESFAMIERADLLVCNDSGPAWMSTLTETPTIVLTGPSRNIFANFDHITQVSHKDTWCTGCHFQQDRGYRLACDYGCESLHSLKPAHVHNLIKERFDGNGSRTRPAAT